ncbi:MAG: hypothetical protein WCY62_11185 [Clostridia bacterium]|jgi:uncharacterized membrane protein
MKTTKAGKLSVIMGIISVIMLVILVATRRYVPAGTVQAIVSASLLILSLIVALVAGIKFVWKDKGRSVAVYISMGVSILLLLMILGDLIADILH